MGKANDFFGMVFNTTTDSIQKDAPKEEKSMVGRAAEFFGMSFSSPTPSQPSLKPPEPVKEASTGNKKDYFTKLIKVESGGNPNAAASTSSAVGLYQFTEGTWKDTTKKMGVSYSLADRTDPEKSRQVVEAFTAKNEAKATRDLGRSPENHELYMYHLLGSAKDLLTASPTEPAADFVQAKQARANKNIFFDKEGSPRTVKEVLTMFKRKFQ